MFARNGTSVEDAYSPSCHFWWAAARQKLYSFWSWDIAVCRTALGQAHQLGVQQRIRSREGDRKITNRSGTLARAVWVTKFSYAGALWSWFSWLYMFELVNCAVFLSWNQESWQIWSLSTSCNMMRRTALGHQLLNLVDFDVYACLANQFISKKSDV